MQMLAESPNNGDAWRAAMLELNAAPVFAFASEEGKILQNGQERVLFFADIDHALLELQNARMERPDQGMKLMPVGLGVAYAAVSEKKAIFVPGPSEVAAAQDLQLAPPEMAASMLAGAGLESPVVQWERDVIPVFGCFQMTRRRADGSRSPRSSCPQPTRRRRSTPRSPPTLSERRSRAWRSTACRWKRW